MKIGIIVGSIRRGRVTPGMANWIATAFKKSEDDEINIIDLRDYPLPLFDEAISPKYNKDRQPEGTVKAWLDVLAEQDAYVIVSPEYDRAVPGVLKNAIDYIDYQMDKKPVALAGHGSYSGAFSLVQLRSIVPELGAVTTPKMLGIPYGQFDAEGNPTGDLSMYENLLNLVVDEVRQYGRALAQLRADQSV